MKIKSLLIKGLPKRSKKGVTLIEVLVAVSIIVIVLAGVLAGVAFTQKALVGNNEVEKASSQALRLTDELMEIVKGIDNAEITDPDFSTDIEAIINDSDSKYVKSGNIVYNASEKIHKKYKVTYDDTSDIAGYKIEVVVYYDVSGQIKSIRNTAFAPEKIIAG